MKTKLALILLILALSPVPCALSQIPQGFNYQAIARDGSGNILPNTPLQAMMYVQSLSTGGTIFWKELHSSVMTNGFGLFTLVVGTGTRQTESTVATFDLIDWSVTSKYLKTEIYYSDSWKDMGTSQLMSVPYALTSGDLAGTVDKLSVKGTTSGLEEALFEVKNRDGQTVFAVYNEGVRVYVSDGAKAVKGGFAVGGFGTDKTESTKYLFVGKDSVRIYLDTNPLTKGVKSGFAVGGYDLTKGTIQNYLDVNSDSVRIYIDSNPATKKLKGGFAVGGYDMTKTKTPHYLRVTVDSTRIITADTLKGFGVGNLVSGNADSYLRLTPSNYFIGHQAGKNITTGLFNSVLGYQSGYALGGGSSNSFLGYKAGYSTSDGNYNVFLGNEAGFTNEGSMNTFIGYISGRNNTTGYFNSFLGDSSGFSNTSGNNNTFLGGRAGFANTEGYYNTFVGSMAGYNNITGRYNTCLGTFSGFKSTTGWQNVIIGYQAGYNNVMSANVYIGMLAGFNNTTGVGNIGIGYKAGYQSTEAWGNVYLGTFAGYLSSGGNCNLIMGRDAGYNNYGDYNVIGGYRSGFNNAGSNNIMIGYQAGINNSTGYNNIIIGSAAGYTNYTGFNNTLLGNSTNVGATALSNATAIGYNAIVSASNNFVLGNSSVIGWGFGVAPGTAAIKVGTSTSNGNGATLTLSGIWTNASDISKKYDIDNISYGLSEVLKLRPVKYKLKGLNNQDIGFIAQEVKKIIPEIVYGVEGEMTLSYGQITSVLTKAIQEQQQQIESYKSELQSIREEMEQIKGMLAKGDCK